MTFDITLGLLSQLLSFLFRVVLIFFVFVSFTFDKRMAVSATGVYSSFFWFAYYWCLFGARILFHLIIEFIAVIIIQCIVETITSSVSFKACTLLAIALYSYYTIFWITFYKPLAVLAISCTDSWGLCSSFKRRCIDFIFIWYHSQSVFAITSPIRVSKRLSKYFNHMFG